MVQVLLREKRVQPLMLERKRFGERKSDGSPPFSPERTFARAAKGAIVASVMILEFARQQAALGGAGFFARLPGAVQSSGIAAKSSGTQRTA